jgi:hypothetical protein
MYGFDFNIGGNAAKQMQEMYKSANDIRTAAKAMQNQFDVIKLPPLSIPTKNPFRDIMPSVTQSQNTVKVAQLATTNPIIQTQKAVQAATTNPIVQTQKVVQSATPNPIVPKMDLGLEDVQKPIITLKERMGSIVTAALDIQRGFEYMQKPLQNAPERWGVIRQSIVDTLVAAQSGDFKTMFDSIKTGFNESLGFINDFRVSWDFAKQGFQGAKTIFGETFKLFTDNAMRGITTAKTMGLTFLTETLPSLLTFVGRGVLSMGGYIASLMGATGAQTALNVVMAANPIGLIVVGIVAVGAAVYGLITYWDTVKQWLTNFTVFFFKNNPFSWILDVVGVFFPNLKQSVYEVFGKIYEFIDKYFIQPIKFAFGWLIDQANGIATDVNTAISGSINPVVTVAPTVDLSGVKDFNKMELAPKLKMPKTDLGIDKKNKEITGENKQVKNINITINSLISGGFTVVSNTINESEQKIKDVITRVLIDATNQVNYQ